MKKEKESGIVSYTLTKTELIWLIVGVWFLTTVISYFIFRG